MKKKENEEIRYKYAVKGSLICNNCLKYADNYNDEYMYTKHPISKKIEEHNEEY